MKSPSFILIIFFICAVFLFAGFIFFAKFYNFVLPEVNGLKYQMDLAAVEDMQTRFAVVIGFIPLALYFTWTLIPLYSPDKKTFSVFIVFICMSLAVFIRYKILVNYFNDLIQSIAGNTVGTGIDFPFTELNYEYYLFGGLISGCVISYLVFHNVLVRRNFRITDRLNEE